jgi:hypothetical protein
MLISISHHISIGNKAEFRLCDKDSAFWHLTQCIVTFYFHTCVVEVSPLGILKTSSEILKLENPIASLKLSLIDGLFPLFHGSQFWLLAQMISGVSNSYLLLQ